MTSRLAPLWGWKADGRCARSMVSGSLPLARALAMSGVSARRRRLDANAATAGGGGDDDDDDEDDGRRGRRRDEDGAAANESAGADGIEPCGTKPVT